MTEAQIDEMYDMMVMDDQFEYRMEGEMIRSFDDLKQLLKQK